MELIVLTETESQTKTPRTVTSALVDRIYTDIVECTLKPGSKLKLGVLSKRYGAGIIPLREALSRLAAAGVVEVQDQKGFSVTPVSLDDLEDTTRVRQQIECLALRQAIERGDINWETQIIAAQHKLSRTSQRDPEDPMMMNAAWEKYHRDLHEALVAGCGSVWLMHFQRILADQSTRYRRLAFASRSKPTKARDVNGEHQRIVDAVLARDADKACALLTDHYQRTADAVRATPAFRSKKGKTERSS
jgi:DNA-binding GntR family transcriptional regulator